MVPTKQMPLAYDEGFEGWTSTSTLTGNSVVRRTAEQAPVDRMRPMTQRASRPAAASRQSDPTTNGDPRRLRPTTDRVTPTGRRVPTATQAHPMAQKAARKSYIPVEDELPGNRQQRRQAQRFEWIRMNLVLFLGLAFFLLVSLLIFLWFVASLAHLLYTNNIAYPQEFGTARGNVAQLVDHKNRFYLLGTNDEGQSYIMLVPDGHPDHAKLLLGPRIPKDAYIRLSVKDVNGDGSLDIVEEIVPPAGMIFCEPQPLNEIFLNDGHGNFKAQQ